MNRSGTPTAKLLALSQVFRGSQCDHTALVPDRTEEMKDDAIMLDDPRFMGVLPVPRFGGRDQIGSGPFGPGHQIIGAGKGVESPGFQHAPK